MKYLFYKYQGTGNDFIIIDDRKENFNLENKELISSLCQRKFGIGADGLILLRNHHKYDFQMIYFNSDGNQSTMCGNGGRCILAFAKKIEIIKNKAVFLAIDGEHYGCIEENIVSIKMKDINKISCINEGFFLDSGSPHFVLFKENLNSIDVFKEGRMIRNRQEFVREGVNVNFVNPKKFITRTYERGVESETLSCGTGAVASAISLHFSKAIDFNLVQIETLGGFLTVSFDFLNGIYQNIWLKGNVELCYIGEFEC